MRAVSDQSHHVVRSLLSSGVLGRYLVAPSSVQLLAHTSERLSLLLQQPERPPLILLTEVRALGETRRHWSPFHREAWAMRQVAPSVPVPKVLQAGYHRLTVPRGYSPEVAYLLHTSQMLPDAYDTLAPRQLGAYFTQLGELSRRLHSIEVDGFGKAFDPIECRFGAPTWGAFVDSVVEAARLERLATVGILSLGTVALVKTRIEEVHRLRFAPRLCHGDLLGRGSVTLDGSLEVGEVLNWGSAHGAPGAASEIAALIATLLSHKRRPDQIRADLHAYLEGYGISPSEYQHTVGPIVDVLLLFRALDVLREILEIRERGVVRLEPWRDTLGRRALSLVMDLVSSTSWL
jgi:hypothetical protein